MSIKKCADDGFHLEIIKLRLQSNSIDKVMGILKSSPLRNEYHCFQHLCYVLTRENLGRKEAQHDIIDYNDMENY